jgi:hypothetical protein
MKKQIKSIYIIAIFITNCTVNVIAQDMSLNISASQPKVKQGETRGTIEIQVCNNDFTDLSANKVVPQISFPSIVGTPVLQGAPLTDWAVESGSSGNTLRIINTTIFPPGCRTFFIGYTANTIGGPSIVQGGLDWNGPQSVGNDPTNDDSNTSVQVMSPAAPVTLTSFTVDEYTKGNLLNWKIKNESGFSHFSVRKSLDLSEFWEIASVKGGNTNGKYQFLDTDFQDGINYYQLKMVDKDGSFEWSKIISIENRGEFGTSTVYPNPSPNRVYNLNNSEDFKEINLLGMDGSIYNVESRKYDGKYEIKVSEQYAAGTYILQFINDDRIIRRKVVLE